LFSPNIGEIMGNCIGDADFHGFTPFCETIGRMSMPLMGQRFALAGRNASELISWVKQPKETVWRAKRYYLNG
jgi:hypothetical protein